MRRSIHSSTTGSSIPRVGARIDRGPDLTVTVPDAWKGVASTKRRHCARPGRPTRRISLQPCAAFVILAVFARFTRVPSGKIAIQNLREPSRPSSPFRFSARTPRLRSMAIGLDKRKAPAEEGDPQELSLQYQTCGGKKSTWKAKVSQAD